MRTAADPVLSHLAPHEHVIWSQQAPRDRLVRAGVVPVMFLVVWCGFIGFVLTDFARMALAAVRHGIDFFSVILIAGVIVLAVVGQFGVRELWSRAHGLVHSGDTHYALTDRRLVIASPRGVVAYGHADVARLKVEGRDILFDWGRVGRRQRRNEGFRAALLDVADAARVAALITKTLATARAN